jgi:hypothetical protein
VHRIRCSRTTGWLYLNQIGCRQPMITTLRQGSSVVSSVPVRKTYNSTVVRSVDYETVTGGHTVVQGGISMLPHVSPVRHAVTTEGLTLLGLIPIQWEQFQASSRLTRMVHSVEGLVCNSSTSAQGRDDMADETPSEKRSESTDKAALNKKVTPAKGGFLQKYKWWLIGGMAVIAGLVFFFVQRSNKNAASADQTAAQQAASTNPYSNGLIDPTTGIPYAEEYGYYGGATSAGSDSGSGGGGYGAQILSELQSISGQLGTGTTGTGTGTGTTTGSGTPLGKSGWVKIGNKKEYVSAKKGTVGYWQGTGKNRKWVKTPIG